jgi:hypothetical protein
MFVNEKPKKMNIYDSLIKYETNHLGRYIKLNFLTNKNTIVFIDQNELLNRITKFFKQFLDLRINSNEKHENSTQTHFTPKIETDDYEIAYHDLKTDYNNLFLELENLKREYSKVVKEKDELLIKLENLNENYKTTILYKEELISENLRLTDDNGSLLQKLEDEKLLVESFERQTDIKDGLTRTMDTIRQTCNTPTLENILIKNDKILGICKFLTPLEILNLKHSSKKIYLHTDSHPSLSKFLFFNIIKRKNKIINQLKLEEDDILEHEESDIEILLRKHQIEEAKQYTEYAQSIMDAVEFVCNDIKIRKADKSNDYISGVTSLFTGLFNKKNSSSSIRTGGQSFSTKRSSNISFSDMVR